MEIKDFLEAIEYKITGGSEYGWNCYGDYAYSLESWNGDLDGYSFHIIFDTITQTVYEVSVCDYLDNVAFKWINPNYEKSYFDEATIRQVTPHQAWDDVDYFLTSEEAILDNIRTVIKKYSEPTTITLNLTEHELCLLSRAAHVQNITLNQFIINVVEEEIKRTSESELYL